MRHVALVAIVMVFEFTVLEGGLHLFGQSEAGAAFQSLFVTDDRIGYGLRPDAAVRYWTSEFDTRLAINAQGVRDDEPIGPKAEDERRVLILGDSYVFAVQVPFGDTMGERLESQLNEGDAAYRWRVINGGVQGYGPVEQWLFYQHVAARFDPDIVLIVVSVANDATEAFDAREKFAAGRAAQGTQTARARSRVRQVVRSSAVLQLVRQRADQLRARISTAVAERPLATYLDTPPAFVHEGLDVATHAFDRLAREARRNGAEVAFVLMPARFQTDDRDYGRMSETAAKSGRMLKRHAATERFSRALTPLGYPILDLLPVFAAVDKGPALHFVKNTHLTTRGHRVTANAMWRFLAERRMVRGRVN